MYKKDKTNNIWNCIWSSYIYTILKSNKNFVYLPLWSNQTLRDDFYIWILV